MADTKKQQYILIEMADTIFLGGVVITVNDAQPEAEAVAVKDGKILAVGSEEKILGKYQTSLTKMVDLKGRTMIPGLVEPHSHPGQAAFYKNHFVSVSGHTHPTMDDLFMTLKQVAQETPAGKWIVAHGFDHVLQEGAQANPPNRQALDKISIKHPIYVMSQIHPGPKAFCNSMAFEVAGVTPESAEVYAEFEIDASGELTGVLLGPTAQAVIWKHTPQLSEELMRQYLQKQLQSYAAQGFTTTADMTTGSQIPIPEAVRVVEEVYKDSQNPVRVIAFYRDNETNVDRLTKYEKGGNFYVAGAKIWADGSPYSATMAVQDPYLNNEFTKNILFVKQTPWYGKLTNSFEDIVKRLYPYHCQGFQIATHAHGERAIENTLKVYEALLKEKPRTDHRYRLEHCGLITEDQLNQCKQLGVSVTFFPDHIYFYGHRLRDVIIGAERASRWTPMALATKAGLCWTVHEDTPSSPLGPFRTMRTAVTRLIRKTDPNAPDEMLGPDYRVSVGEALKAWTINAAWQLFHEDLIGSIEEGKLADLVILSANPYDVLPKKLDQIMVIATYRSGKCVYKSAAA